MDELSPVNDHAQMQGMVRTHLAVKLKDLCEALEPYIDGTLGPVSSRHVTNYLNALKLLGQLYRVYDPPRIVANEQEPLETAKTTRARVLGQLQELERRARINSAA